MNSLILHHYPLSPFSEKVRAALGYAHLEWHSAQTREMPPRPVLQDLAGGYRKIPVAQIGADVFCDSKTICAEIARLGSKPELMVEHASPEIREFVEDVESRVFFACIASSATWALNRKAMKTLSILDLVKMVVDRAKIGRDSSVKMHGMKVSKAIVRQHVLDMEHHLGKAFLFGDSPTIADFAAYHSLWFARDLAERSITKSSPRVDQWLDRIKAFGHGKEQPMDPMQALEIARSSEPRAIDAAHQQDPLQGKKVQVAPSDYAKDATHGVLVGATAESWILGRESRELGKVHVHFPKLGFRLSEA